MRILYGKDDKNIDVTELCLQKMKFGDAILIPEKDNIRANYFTDPLPGIHKDIIIITNEKKYIIEENYSINVNIVTEEVLLFDEKETEDKLRKIHSQLRIKYGSLMEEVPEQKMVIKYLTGSEKVLEIGGNIGRNSLVISKILNEQSNLVTLESDINISKKLIENRNINNHSFFIEPSALSKRKLIQKDWDTKPSDKLETGYSWVDTINFEKLKKRYNINFDTLVLDCEGAFYYILQDMPEILDNINKIIMENDYFDISHYNFVQENLKKRDFKLNYRKGGGWGPCSDNFFEVWLK